MIGKIIRFVHNPVPYFRVMRDCLISSWAVVMLYRLIFIPFLVRRVSRKKIVNVIFLAMNPDMWRYDGVYRRLKADSRFKPVIVTAMRNCDDMDIVIAEQEKMVQYFLSKGFDVIRGYDHKSDSWIDISAYKPDIIFHTQPYENVMKNRCFAHWRHLGALHCYSPYAFALSKVDWNWNNPLQNYAWLLFYVGKYQVCLSRTVSKIKGVNARAAGYCLEEELCNLARNSQSADATWHNDIRKRVIWAPHHSISRNESFRVSSFLEIADEMLRIRGDYKDRVIFAFKPHPVLKTKLYEKWGKERTEAYYAAWANAENAFDAQGDYHDLFVGSDAMIHCSGSFIVEYLYTNKPVQYVYAKTRNPPDLGEIGDAALLAHYSAHDVADIRSFLNEVVLGGKDTKSQLREEVAEKYLKSDNGMLFSENVYHEVLKGLGWQNA